MSVPRIGLVLALLLGTALLAALAGAAESTRAAALQAVAAPAAGVAAVKACEQKPPSAAARAADDVLEAAALAEAQAIHEAVEADEASRVGVDDGSPAFEEDAEKGFRSFAELYQWAVKASTRDRVSDDGDRQSSTFRTPESDARFEPPVKHDQSIAAPDTSNSAQEHGSCESSGPGAQNVCAADETQSRPVSDDSHPSTQAAQLARRLQELENIGNELPEFEGEVVILERAVKVLKSDDHATDAEVLHALETIDELCHSGDNGRDLHTLGGLKLVVGLLSAPSDPVYQAAAKALSTCVRNNPPVAHAAADTLGAVQPLLRRASAPAASFACRARALLALVALADAAPAAKNALEADSDSTSMVVAALKTAIDGLGGGKDENRGALRALALAETVSRGEGEADKRSEAWRKRMHDARIPASVRQILETPDGYSPDAKEAAARLARALKI